MVECSEDIVEDGKLNDCLPGYKITEDAKQDGITKQKIIWVLFNSLAY